MITVRVEIVGYDNHKNVCTGKLLNGDLIEIDPYVGCAIILSDDDYKKGKGADIVGKSYLLTEYTVYTQNVVPHENGMIEL